MAGTLSRCDCGPVRAIGDGAGVRDARPARAGRRSIIGSVSLNGASLSRKRNDRSDGHGFQGVALGASAIVSGYRRSCMKYSATNFTRRPKSDPLPAAMIATLMLSQELGPERTVARKSTPDSSETIALAGPFFYLRLRPKYLPTDDHDSDTTSSEQCRHDVDWWPQSIAIVASLPRRQPEWLWTISPQPPGAV